MPYFKNENVNILYIHIPKTGGSSIEKYFSKKYNIPLNKDSLYNHFFFKGIHVSSQHITYNTIHEFNVKFKIDFNNLKIITSVRNPYERLISELFYINAININSTTFQVEQIIKAKMYALMKNIHIQDNHFMQQYKFLLDKNNKINPNIIILKNESLNKMMNNNGFSDFNEMRNSRNKNTINYYKFLNKTSINIINKVYKKDFELFNYKML